MPYRFVLSVQPRDKNDMIYLKPLNIIFVEVAGTNGADANDE